MKRPWAFICASEGATSKHLRNYCREVYLLGYLPVCPKLQDSQYLVLEDAVERSEYTAIVREMQSSTKFCAEQNCNLITAQQGMTIRQQCKSSAPAKNSNPQIHFQNHSTAPSSAKSSYTSIHISTSNCETDRHYNKEEHHEQRKNHRNSSH